MEDAPKNLEAAELIQVGPAWSCVSGLRGLRSAWGRCLAHCGGPGKAVQPREADSTALWLEKEEGEKALLEAGYELHTRARSPTLPGNPQRREHCTSGGNSEAAQPMLVTAPADC